MSTSTASDNGISHEERNFDYFHHIKKNIFYSTSFLNDESNVTERRSNFHKSFSLADKLPGSLSNGLKKRVTPKKWNQPSGMVSQILQEKRNVLIENLKQKVKVLAEESVTRSYIQEESSNVTAFCGTVDDCLRFGLILRRPVMNYREPRTFSLLKEISRSLPEAKKVVRLVQEMEEGVNRSGNTFSLPSLGYSESTRWNSSGASGSLPKHLWIRIALFQKTLDKIVDYLVEHADANYERVSILAHPFDGPLFADLIRGPCTHDFTKNRTNDHLWTDPSAGELMQRKMIYSAGIPQSTKETRTISQLKNSNWKRDKSHTRLSLDSGICVSSSLNSVGQQPTQPPPSATYTPTGDFFLHFEPDSISPASMLYLLTPPVYADRRRDSDGSSTNEALGYGRCQEGGFSFDSEECSRAFHFQHQHSIFSPGPTVQKLSQAKDYVESLHQNERTPLLYGKNNVIVQPSMSTARISGYLSMHKTGTDEDSGLQLKWAPNRAMSVIQDHQEQQLQKRRVQKQARLNGHQFGKSNEDVSKITMSESSYWDFALDIDIKKVVYIHCHRHHVDDFGGTVILVRSDGIQYPPLDFPAFSQVISFMQCLETHLSPRGSLNPPTEEVNWDDIPEKMKSGSSPVSPMEDCGLPLSPTINKPTHFCFRIDIAETPPVAGQETGFRFFASTRRNSSRRRAPSTDNFDYVSKSSTPSEILPQIPVNAIDAFSNTCHSMQYQILARVFNGWLAYTRSINQIRNRLQNLVYPRCLMPKPPPTELEPLTADFWYNFRLSGGKTNRIREVYERIYFAGCDPALRQEVWPFLLGHYPWSASAAEMDEIDRRTRMAYEQSVSEWLAAEVIILQMQHCARNSVAGGTVRRAATNDALKGVNNRSRSISGRHEQTVEEMLSFAWNRVKRRISTATASSTKRSEEVNESANVNGLPPLPPKGTHESRSFNKTNHGLAVTAYSNNSAGHTDDDTEECTLTTTDEDDAVETAAAASRARRLALARAHSCPNSDRLPNNNHAEALMRTATSSRFCKEVNVDEDDVFNPPERVNEQSNKQPVHAPRERKQSRYSKAEISGATYSNEVLEALSVNIQRIDKDVARCDRNYYYFSKSSSAGENPRAAMTGHPAEGLCVASLDISDNLYRLRTIMCTWIWQHMDIGYVQGMCDLLAPLLVVLEDEALTYACFSQLMVTMLNNFPLVSGAAVVNTESAASAGILLPHFLEKTSFERAPNRRYDYTRPKTKRQILEDSSNHRFTNGQISGPIGTGPSPNGSTRINRQFEGLRNLIEVLDPVLAEHMHLNEDNSHLYFYRWLLLDFKREFKYADVFLAWETIWTSTRLVCPDFEIFIAFALIQYYRDIILFYCLDYTDIIRFYNERAEQHDLPRLLTFARDLIYRLQTIVASITSKPTTRIKTLPAEN